MPLPSSSGRQLHSWRAARRQDRSSSARWIGSLFTIFLLASLSWLLWLLLPSRLPQTHVVAITTGDAHKFTVPPIPYAQESLAKLTQISAPSYSFHDFSRFQEATNINDLGGALKGLPMKEKDVLVVYLSAIGVSEDGTAYLLCRDYDLRDTEAGRYQATELLDQLKQSSAKTKLLVMDTGWILSDPRLGMLANEFPLLLANDIAGQDDPGLWVLLSCSALESPTVLFAEQQTVFGQCFADGLLGSADLWDRGGNDDGFVSLDELFTFVFTACRQATAGVQTPMLLHAGTRLDQITSVPAGIQLTRANLQAREDQAEDAEEDLQKTPPNKKKENTATTQPENSAEVADQVTSDLVTSDLATSDLAQGTAMAEPAQIESDEGVNAQGESPPANGTGQSAAVRGQPSDTAETAGRTHAGQLAPEEQVPLPELLYRAWQLRDRLEALPDTSGRWSPIEYAPLQWRELNALLLDIDQRSRAGDAFDQTRLRGQLKTHLDGLTRLAQEENIDAFDGDQSLVVDRLLIVANRFAGSTERASFATKSRKLREVGKAVRYFYRATFRLSDYLRCHREIVVGWADYPSVQDITRQLDVLADGLLRFQHELHDREGERLVDSLAEDAIVVLARSLSETEANLKTMFQTLGETLAANSNQAVNRDRVVGLLQTSIWNAEQRQRLTTCLNRPLAPARLAPSDSAILPQQWPVSARIGEQLAQHAALQLKVFELAGVATPEIAPQLAAFDAARRSLSVGDRHFWQEARLLGQTCKSLHLALSEQIQRDSPATAIRCLDARDASDWALADQRDFFPRLGLLPPREPDRLDVVQKPAGLLRLEENPVVVDMEVRPSNPGMRFVTVTPKYDDSRLRVVRAGGVKVQPGRPVRLQVSSEQMAQLQLQIDTASELAEDVDDSQFLVELLIQAGALTVPHTIQCSRPKPNEVDLYVDRIDPPARARRFGRNGTELRPLVNRTSYFRILLANLSGQDKEVDVALYRIPESDWTPGRLVDEYGEPFADIRSWLFQTGNKRLLPDIEPVAKTGQSMKLPADARPREVDLSPPAGPAADAGESPPVEPPRVAVTNGLVCVITNIANPSERWVKWIEVNPLTPRDYVEPHVAYDVDLEEITIDVRGIDADGDGQPDQFPGRAALAEQPIEISWDTTGVVPPGSERNDRALIDRPESVARLNARVPTHPTRTAIIRLKVDGYPRAFLYELALSRDNQGRDIRRDERSIRLTSLQMQNEPRVFRTGRRDGESEPTAGDEEKVEALYLQPGRPAAFGVPGKGNAILVGFEVDAPLDAFSFRDRSDVIEIGFSKAGFPTTRLFSDRARHAWLHTPTRNGFAVSTQVDDYVGEHAVPLDIAGLKNARVRVRARLEVDQNDPPPHELEVVLDGEAPVVTSLHAPAVVQQGHPVSISMDVKDLSGPAQAVIGIVARRGDPLKLEQAFVQERFSSTATTDRWPIVASLDSAQLVPNEYFVKTRVTDRVGRQTEALTPVTIVAPLPIKKEKTQPLRGTIRGVVRFGPSFKPDRITVRINGGAFEPTTTANGGRFRFENVPAGNYTLEARGPVKGYIKQGKTDIELKQKADYAREISIDLTESGS